MLFGWFGSVRGLLDCRSNRSDIMKVGDKIEIDFAGKKKDALVFKLFSSSVYLKVDFENDKGKILKRKLSQIENKKSTSNKEKKK